MSKRQRPPRNIKSLSRAELETVVRSVQDYLWNDGLGYGSVEWNADKEWDSDTVEDIAGTLASVGLRPE